MSQLVPLGPGTAWDGFQLNAFPTAAANSFPSSVPLTTFGPTPQPTLPPNISGGIGGNMASGGAVPMVNAANLSASKSAGSSHSPVIPAIAAIAGSVLLLHFVFWPKEKLV